ncbi:DUF885 domain-containing protein [Aquisediminimonas sediminicola]|uniref:DUF885 domain-containing protein n=1 Tax=Alteraquisediminimonas sediminicola TaxID=2676787 RepID=UPI001FE61774|nr:DUF885 domain-containing protein [Aquisediminimonas sediminicola]
MVYLLRSSCAVLMALLMSGHVPAMAEMATPVVAAPTTIAAPEEDADHALIRLFAESDEASLRRNPINALFRGDLRYASKFGDYVTEAFFDGERMAARADLVRLRAIDRDRLNPTNRVAYDSFRWQTEMTLKGLSPPILAGTAVRPLDHFSGFQTFYPDLASGQSAAPFKTIADYDNNLLRNSGYVRLLDRSILRFREGLTKQIVHPRLIVQNMIDQFAMQLGQSEKDAPFLAPIAKFPADFSAADKARLSRAYLRQYRQEIRPAYRRMHDFLKNIYLPKAREGVGLVHMKGGPALYDYLIEQNTTLPLSADQVHQIGLAEVERIRGEMETIKAKVGFSGTLAQFFDFIRTDARFKPMSKEALRDGYFAIGQQVDKRVREQFSVIPKTPLEIRAVPAYREKTDAGGSYQQGSADGTRPGIFYFNTYDLPSRTTPGMETLYLHEAIPGHHFQISLAQENKDLPAFMRFGGNTAYVEGWALYAESLWHELGMEQDPYSRFGGLDDEMLRAMRLVVDTGIHAKGWTRQQAMEYMIANSSMGETDVRSEVERYIAIPGQALAYKIGQMTIAQMKARAQAVLGKKFDPREFHAQILMTGALPMAVLENKIDTWLAERK